MDAKELSFVSMKWLLSCSAHVWNLFALNVFGSLRNIKRLDVEFDSNSSIKKAMDSAHGYSAIALIKAVLTRLLSAYC